MENEIPFELSSLQAAVNYQLWMADAVRPFLGQRILELGAGIGNMSVHLPARELLVLSEAEKNLLPVLHEKILRAFGSASTPEQRVHTIPFALGEPLAQQLGQYNFDTLVSFNVLEHIENDGAALQDFRALLEQSKAAGPKRIISVVPAHAWAFGTIDKSFGHYRRYNLKGFRSLAQAAGFPVDTKGVFYARYFNLFGLPGWFLLNRILKRKAISSGPIKAFEKICPLVRGFDDFLHKCLRIPLGQSLLCVLELPAKGNP